MTALTKQTPEKQKKNKQTVHNNGLKDRTEETNTQIKHEGQQVEKRTYTHTHTRIYIYIHTLPYIYVYIYICVCVCIHSFGVINTNLVWFSLLCLCTTSLILIMNSKLLLFFFSCFFFLFFFLLFCYYSTRPAPIQFYWLHFLLVLSVSLFSVMFFVFCISSFTTLFCVDVRSCFRQTIPPLLVLLLLRLQTFFFVFLFFLTCCYLSTTSC